MKKMTLALCVSAICMNCFAVTHDTLNNSLKNVFNQQISIANQNPFTIIYGGQDFSNPQIAIADESFWSGQPQLIG